MPIHVHSILLFAGRERTKGKSESEERVLNALLSEVMQSSCWPGIRIVRPELRCIACLRRRLAHALTFHDPLRKAGGMGNAIGAVVNNPRCGARGAKR